MPCGEQYSFHKIHFIVSTSFVNVNNSQGVQEENRDVQELKETKEKVKDVPVFANTGVSIDNVEEIFKFADGCVIGSHLKHEGITWNNIDINRVKSFMDKVNKLRS